MLDFLDGMFIRTRGNILDDSFDVYIGRRENDKVVAVADVITLHEHQISQASRPVLQMSTRHAQRLFDDLWEAGLRPSDYAGEGVIKAMQDHIDSLRGMLKAKGNL